MVLFSQCAKAPLRLRGYSALSLASGASFVRRCKLLGASPVKTTRWQHYPAHKDVLGKGFAFALTNRFPLNGSNVWRQAPYTVPWS